MDLHNWKLFFQLVDGLTRNGSSSHRQELEDSICLVIEQWGQGGVCDCRVGKVYSLQQSTVLQDNLSTQACDLTTASNIQMLKIAQLLATWTNELSVRDVILGTASN